jgi:hypothetical protein
MTIPEGGPEKLMERSEDVQNHRVDVGIQPALAKDSLPGFNLSQVGLHKRMCPETTARDMEVVVRRKSGIAFSAKNTTLLKSCEQGSLSEEKANGSQLAFQKRDGKVKQTLLVTRLPEDRAIDIVVGKELWCERRIRREEEGIII